MSLFASVPEKRNRRAGENIEAGIVGFGVGVAVVVVVCSAGFALAAPGDWKSQLGVGVTAAALSLAALAVGVVLGFLFGLPRARVPAEESDSSTTKASAAGTHFLANSNLVKVSDWLTTILIGLGLVQLGRVAPAVSDFADALEGALGGTTNAGVYAVSIMVTVAISGAVMMYLWTSIRIRELFEQVEDEHEELRRAVGIALEVEVSRYLQQRRNTDLVPTELEEDIALLYKHADESAIVAAAGVVNTAGLPGDSEKTSYLQALGLLKAPAAANDVTPPARAR